MKILILGAGGHGQVIADALLCAQRAGHGVTPIGFLDDAAHLHGQYRLGLPVLGTLDDVAKVTHDAVIVAIGDNNVRRRVFDRLRQIGERFATAIHPSAIIADDVQIGAGTLVCAGVVVNTGTVIGDDVILNTGSTVDHHNQIGDHTHIAPGVHLGGDVLVGTGVLIGIGATVMPQRRVGEWAVVGAGAVVTSEVAPHVTVVGVPARVQSTGLQQHR